MTVSNRVIVRGEDYAPKDEVLRYEKTSTDDERVANLGLSRGTADNQLVIYEANAIPAAVGLNQRTHPGTYESKDDSKYAHDGEPIDYASEGNFTFKGVLDNGQSITRDQALQFESGTGKIQVQTSNPRCGYAAETASASDGDGEIKVNWDPEHTIIETETVTFTAHAGTLTYPAIEIYHVEAIAGSADGGKTVILDDTTPAAGDVYWNGTTGLTGNTTDAITSAKVRYRHA